MFVPVVIGEILAEVVVGRTGLDLVDPPEPTVAFGGDVGVATLMFTVGAHIALRDPRLLTSAVSPVLVVGVAPPGSAWAGGSLATFGRMRRTSPSRPRLTLCAPNRLRQIVTRGLGEHDAVRPGPQGLAAEGWIGMHRERDDRGLGCGLAQARDRLEAGAAGHAEVQDEHGWPVRSRQAFGIRDGSGCGNDPQALLVVDQQPQGLTNERVVVGDDDRDRAAIARFRSGGDEHDSRFGRREPRVERAGEVGEQRGDWSRRVQPGQWRRLRKAERGWRGTACGRCGGSHGFRSWQGERPMLSAGGCRGIGQSPCRCA